MITVRLHGTNFFSLKGDNLKPESMPPSSIELQSDGWTVKLVVSNRTGSQLLERTGLVSDRVIEMIAVLLDEYRLEEDVDEDEIRKYMRVVWRDFRYLLTESEQRRVVAP